MKPYDYLIDYTLKNIWQSPYQDASYVIEPDRITDRYGEFNTVSTNWRLHKLPKDLTRFHVFQYGQLFPTMLGLKRYVDKWVCLEDFCNETKTLVEVYSKDGLMIPRKHVFFMTTLDNNLIMAVEELEEDFIFNFGEEAIYFRFYSNAYFRSTEAINDSDENKIIIKNFRPITNSQIALVQNEIEAIKTTYKDAEVSVYVSGYYTENATLLNTKIGDYVECVVDTSKKYSYVWKYQDLKEFESILDTRRKYLLHYPVYKDYEPNIDYKDDIDIFIYEIIGNDENRYKGVYYHHNASDWLRNLTHRDYSIPTQLVHSYINAHKWTNLSRLRIKMVIKKNIPIPLVYNASRIQDLYRLSDKDIPRAMIGIDSTVDIWQAANLENSWFSKTMNVLDLDKYTKANAEASLGYNAISLALAKHTHLVERVNGAFAVHVPYLLQPSSTGFEYTDKGILTDFYFHYDTTLYPTRNSNTKYVDLITNLSNNGLDEYWNVREFAIDTTTEFKCYRCSMYAGNPDYNWEDVTNSGEYVIENGIFKWLNDPDIYYNLVRTNRQNLVYRESISPFKGNLRFNIKQNVYLEGVSNTINMQIPMGELDIYLNGHSLIEGIDYFVEFPTITIVSKKYFKKPVSGKQDVVIRYTNFCDSDLEYKREQQYGWVNHGVISHNHVYNLKDDKNQRLVIGGRIYCPSEIDWKEDGKGTVSLHPLNGLPYMTRDVVNTFKGMTDKSAYELKEIANVEDEVITNYLTEKITDKPFGNPNAALERYVLFSPFINAISHDLESGLLDDPRFYQPKNDNIVRDIAKPYEHLLRVDPTQFEGSRNNNFIVIVPHVSDEPIVLDLFKYEFLERVIEIYSRGLISMSHFYKIESY